MRNFTKRFKIKIFKTNLSFGLKSLSYREFSVPTRLLEVGANDFESSGIESRVLDSGSRA